MATEGDRQARDEEEEEEGRDIVRTAQLSLAQVDIGPPFLPSAALFLMQLLVQ